MNVGELVTYIEGTDPKTKRPIQYAALVLGERHITDHAGKNGEPLLTIVFAKERIDAHGVTLPVHGTGQQSELIQTRLDVAHVSHAYDDDQKKKYGKQSYDGGRWTEAPTQSGFTSLASKLSARESEISGLRSSLAASQKALNEATEKLAAAEKAAAEKKE